MNNTTATTRHTNDLGFILYDEFVVKYGAENCVYRDGLVEFWRIPLPSGRCTCPKCNQKLEKGSIQYKMVDAQSKNGGYTVHIDCPMDKVSGSEWSHEKGNHDVHNDYESNNVDNHTVIIKSNEYRCEWLKRHGFKNFGKVKNVVALFGAKNGWNSGHLLPQFLATRCKDDEVTVNSTKVATVAEYHKAIGKKI